MSDSVNEALLQQRIDRLEAAVSSISGSTSNTRAGGKPPKPTGLVSTTQPGIIAFAWDPVFVSDLRYYEIQTAENEGMTGATTLTTTDPRFTYYGGVPGVEYFARTRTVNRSDLKSDWTNVVSSVIGLVDAALLDTSNTIQSDFFAFIEPAGTTFSIDLVNPGAVTSSNFTFGPAFATTDSADSIVDLRVIITATKNVDFPDGGKRCDLTLALLERKVGGSDVVIFSQPLAMKVKDPAAGSAIESDTFIPFAPPPRKPGVGAWEYRVKITGTAEGTNDIQMNFTDLRITALVFN